jgi:prepilin peptidase CpaA
MSAIDILRWPIAILFSAMLAAAAISDVRNRLIPNWAVLAIAALFVSRAALMPWSSTLSSLEAAGIVFFLSFGLFALRIIGAGDSKLITVTALFIGLEQLPQFAFATSLVGGAIAIVSLAANPRRALVMLQMRGKGNSGQDVPYGVAIAVAGVFTFLPSLSR